MTDHTAEDSAVREGEEKYRVLFDMESDALFLIDNEVGQILEVNPAATALYGYSRAELLAKRNVDLSAEPDDTRAATETHRPRVPVRYHRKKDGTVFPVEITARHFVWRGRDAHIAAIRDITERQRADDALVRRTRQLEALRETTGEVSRELDLHALLGLIARRAMELIEATRSILFLWEDDAGVLRPCAWHGYAAADGALLQLCLRPGEGVAGTVVQRRQGMIVNDYRGSPHAHPPVLDHTNITAALAEPLLYRERIVGVLLMTHDGEGRGFTDEDRETVRLLAGQAAIAIENARLYQDEQRRRQELEAVRAVSEELARELDLTVLLRLIHGRAMELVGGDSGSVCLWDEAAQVVIPKSWQGVGPWMADVRVRPGEGVIGTVAAERKGMLVNDFRTSPYATPFWLERSPHVAGLAEPLLYRDRLVGVITLNRNDPARPFRAEDQRVLRLFAAPAAIAIENARLVAQMTRAAEELQQARDELVRAETLRALGQMAAGVAHDLNNILAAVLGQAELLRLRVSDLVVHESLNVLETAAMDGAHVVRQLQDFARQRTTSPLAPLDLAAVVREALEITRPRWQDEAQRQGRVIEVQADLADLPLILGHAAEVREALTNLIVNAVDAMPLGGRLTLAGSPATNGVLLAIADTGTGMADAVRQRLFEPFFTTKGAKGTGLGLSVVYGIMERHHGGIEIQSAVGRGTTFTLRFQAAPRAMPPHKTATPPRPSVARRILVIDDEAAVRQTLAALLRAAGHTVTEAADGTAGLALLPATPVDVVITDLGMPEVTGWDVARAIKARTPRLPVLLLTGWGERAGVETGDAKRIVDRILGKPCRLEDLLEAIGEVCSR